MSPVYILCLFACGQCHGRGFTVYGKLSSHQPSLDQSSKVKLASVSKCNGGYHGNILKVKVFSQ